MQRSYHVLDLFSGVGGFALGLRNSPLREEQTYFSEVDPYCQRVLAKNFPEAIQLGDVREINGKELKKRGSDWIVTGGFPCQDLSVCGKKRGLDGDRSSLWFQMQRLVEEIRPRWVVAENVRQLCRSGLDRVCRGLAECGYVTEWRTFSAVQFGLPHNRHRVWITAYPESLRGSVDQFMQTEGRGLGAGPEPDCKVGSDPAWVQWFGAIVTRSFRGEPLVSRVDDGLSDRLDRLARVKALGNALVPKIPETIFNRLAEIDDAIPR